MIQNIKCFLALEFDVLVKKGPKKLDCALFQSVSL